MQVIIHSSKYRGGSYRDKRGVICNSFGELLSEVTRLYNLAKLEKTDEHISIQIEQERVAAPMAAAVR
jgi:hypothetical protein